MHFQKLPTIMSLAAILFSSINIQAADCGKADCVTEPGDNNSGNNRFIPPPKSQPAGWDICNKTAYAKINISIGYQAPSGHWYSKGPYWIGRNNCSKVLGHIANRNLYYLVRVDDKVLNDKKSNNDSRFCVAESLNKKYKAKLSMGCNYEGYKMESFDKTNSGGSQYLKTNVYR